MRKIFIAGLGPGSIDALTLGTVNRINSGLENFLRTKYHPTTKYFEDQGIPYNSFDSEYDELENFEQVYDSIVKKLKDAVEEFGTINYFVPGNPMVAEKTVSLLLEDHQGIEIEIVSGMSFIEPLLEITGIDPIHGLKILDGIELKATQIDINTNIIITQVYNNRLISEVKLKLSEIYGDNYMVYLIHNGGIVNMEKVEYVPMMELDKSKEVGALSSILVPRVNKETDQIYDHNDVLDTMKTLRGENGCPWDKEQNHLSIRQSLLEEAYELIEAIEDGDAVHIAEELGDLLFQVVFHTEIGYENGEFYPIDITTSLVNKLITRHPHVFFEKNVDNSEEVVYNWNKIKYTNRNISTLADKLRNIPRLPALMRSYKVQEKAAEVGFDWDSIEGPKNKIIEEYNELLEAAASNSLGHPHIETELGDLLFAVVNLSRFLKVNPEVALNKTIVKFTKRLETMEFKAKIMGIELEEMSLEELDSLWNQVKDEE